MEKNLQLFYKTLLTTKTNSVKLKLRLSTHLLRVLTKSLHVAE